MGRTVQRKNQGIAYEMRHHERARRVKLAVYTGGRVVLTLPPFVSFLQGEKFLSEHWLWLNEKVRKMQRRGEGKLHLGIDRADYEKRKAVARNLVLAKIQKLNQVYNFRFNKIAIRNQATRWGSCSQDGNLNFNYKILDLPDRLAEYIVAHELCHLEEFSHNQRFWRLVARTIPEYRLILKNLKEV